MAAAVARPHPGLPPARKPRRHPRWPLRRRFCREQFALPEAIGLLREARRQPDSGALISLSGADPLNLVGILTPGPRLAALTGNRLLYRDGVPIALLAAGEVQFLETLDPASEWAAHKALLRGAQPAPSIAPSAKPRVPSG